MIVLLLNLLGLAFSIFIIVIVILTWINTNKLVNRQGFENFGEQPIPTCTSSCSLTNGTWDPKGVCPKDGDWSQCPKNICCPTSPNFSSNAPWSAAWSMAQCKKYGSPMGCTN